jgi:hypothetical protein
MMTKPTLLATIGTALLLVSMFATTACTNKNSEPQAYGPSATGEADTSAMGTGNPAGSTTNPGNR